MNKILLDNAIWQYLGRGSFILDFCNIGGYFNEPKNVAVYLIKHLRNNTLKHVGEQFGIEKYSAVSSIVEREKYEMKADKGLKKRIQHLAETIIKSQQQTLLFL